MKNKYDKIRTQLDDGEYKRAEKSLRKLLQGNSSDVGSLVLMTRSLLCQSKYAKALDFIKRAEVEIPCHPLVLYYKGRCLLYIDRFKESLQCWDMLLGKDVHDAACGECPVSESKMRSLQNDALLYKSFCYRSLYCMEESEMFARQHLAGRRKGLCSDFTKAYVMKYMRELRYTSRNPADRYKDFTDGVLTDVQGNRLLDFLNKIEKEGDTERVLRYYRRKTREYPNDYYLWTLFSEYCYDHRLKEECLASAARAYALVDNRDDMQVLYDYASALYLNCRWSDAVAVLDDLLSRDINFIAYGEHGEGMTWAKALVRHAAKIREDCTRRMSDPEEALKTIKL